MIHLRSRLGPSGSIRRLSPVVLVITALVLVLGAGVATVVAKNIVCPFATECIGGKKADTIRGEGQNNLFGKAGEDKITSAGNSVVDGGSARDTIRAFAGGNIIRGGKGNDVINAVNDAFDDIDCGPGRDKVLYDANLDDPVNCEDRRPQ